MRAVTLQEACAAMGGRMLGTSSIPTIEGVSTDSRSRAEGSLFFAIAGERYDGHHFVEAALDGGAVAAVVSDLPQVHPRHHENGRLILVSNTVEALGKLAAWYRKQCAAQVIAVVGSNGKTTVKEMIAAVLGSKKRGRAAPASYNNAIGVPLTLLSVDPADAYVVTEIGTNHPGEIAALGRIAQPDMAVITSIDEEHLEFFGTVEAVASEEFSLLATMNRRGFVAMSEQAARFAPPGLSDSFMTLTYGLGDAADLRATDVTPDREGQRFQVNGRFPYRLRQVGAHNIANALAAVAIGTRLRLTHEEIAEALAKVRSPAMRLERSKLGRITLINDAYNANPGSMRAAFEVMDQWPDAGRKVLILGDMLELGDQAARCHQAVGREAGRGTAQVIIAVGTHARVLADGATGVAGTSKRIYAFPTLELLAEKVDALIQPGDVVLIKASRGMRLERLVEPLRRAASTVSVSTPRAGATVRRR